MRTYGMKSYKVVTVHWAQVHQLSVVQHYLMVEDGGDSTW